LTQRGADLTQWPEAERRDAEALLARSFEAARLHDEAVRIEQVLRHASPAASPEAVERVLARLDTIPDYEHLGAESDDGTQDFLAVLPAPIRGPWLPAALFACLLAVGFLLGAAAAAPPPASQATNFVDLLANRTVAGFDL
jgi:hypothetical protein